MTQITYEQFELPDIRAMTIVKVEEFPRAKKSAYKVWADSGHEIGVLQISAQVTVHYSPEILLGRQIAGCINLGEKNIAGFKSEFLLLGFPDNNGFISLIKIDPKVPNAQKIC